MEKRLVVAIALSLLVLVTWSNLANKSYQKISRQAVPSASPVTLTPLPEKEALPSSVITYIQEGREIVFLESQAAIKEVIFRHYQSYKFTLEQGFLLSEPGLVFKKISQTPEALIFQHQDENKKIIKRFIFSKSNHVIELEVEVSNLSNLTLTFNPTLILGILDFSRDPNQARFQDVAVGLADKTLHHPGRQEMRFAQTKFLSLRDRYFCNIAEPQADGFFGFVKKINSQKSEIGLSANAWLLADQQTLRQKFRIYLGPQDLQIINHLNPQWSAVIYYGMFNSISHLLLQLLNFFSGLVHNWGVAIVLLSISIYLLLFPLTLKQMRSMKQMQALQPSIQELQKVYKDNPQRLNKELMELYRKNKVNPFSGCLPLVLQLPIFLSLYQALIRSIALKGARFLWIKDLSEPDRLWVLPNAWEINLLPILMALGMYLQQKISPATSSGSTEQQKIMLILFPLMFGFIFYRMPAGLVLYWFVNSIFMLAYQFRISKPPHQLEN